MTTLIVRMTRRLCAAVSMLSLLALAAGDASAATLRWTGAHATSSDWSRGANWDTGTAPANGDTLVFPAGAARLANNNDLTGLQVAVIRFNGVGGGYTLSGNGVVVTDSINANQTAGNNTIALARITLANPMSFSVAQVGFSLAIDSEVRLNGNDLTADATGFLVLRGVVSGAGNVIKTGDGLLTVNGPVGNTFTGDLRVNAGTVFLGKAAGLAVTNRLIIGDGAGGSQADGVGMLADNQVTAVTINSSGLWSLGNFENEVSDFVLNRGGDVTTGASGKLRLGPGADITVTPGDTPATVESSISGNLELAAGIHRFTVDNGDNTLNNSTLLIDAMISGLGGINKQGRDNLELAGANSFGGTVTVNSGILFVKHDLALGLTTSGTRVNDSAQLILLADVSGESLTLDSGGLTPSVPTALSVSGEQVWTGNVTLLRDTTIRVDGTVGLLDLSGVISGSGAVTKTGLGTLRFSGTGANTYVGDTYVNEGTLELDKGTIGGVLAVPGRLIIGDGVGGEHADVARHRKNNQVNTVTVNGSGLWDLDTHEEEVSDLDLNDGGDVTTAATGLLRLGIGADVSGVRTSSASDLFGTITGNLELLLGPHTFTVDAGVGVSGGYTISIDAAVSGLGGITKEGPMLLALSHANNFAGSVTVNVGKLVAYDSQALGSTLSGTRINSGTSFEMVFDGTVAGEAITLDNSLFISIKHIVWTGNVTLLGQATLNVGSSSTFDGSLDISGVISGNGGFTKLGKDPLTLSGNSANTYSDVTTVNQGRLVLNKSGVNVAVAGDLIVGDDTGGANADVVECLAFNELDPRSAVTLNSSGQFIARQESIGSIAGSGNISVSSSLGAGGNHASTTFSGVISGAGAFNKSGLGTLTLTGNNTYTGGTGVADGTLLVKGQQPTSVVLIQPQGTLGGVGRVGNLSTFANGPTVSPGASPGRLTSGNVILGANSIFRVELDGPTPGATHDQLRALGTVNLGGAELQATLNFIPTLGQPLVIIDNDGVDAVVDQFKGLAEGDTLRVNQIPFVISYKGGDGNDVTLTATNRSLSLVSTRVEAGNGNGVIDPNECDHLFVALMNETGNPLAVSHVVLDSATPGIAVTKQSSEYAPFGALDIRTNRTPFQIRTTPDFVCGQLIDFLLTVTVTGGGGGTFTIPFTVPSGPASAPVPFDNGANLNLPDLASATSTITVANAAPTSAKLPCHCTSRIHPPATSSCACARLPARPCNSPTTAAARPTTTAAAAARPIEPPSTTPHRPRLPPARRPSLAASHRKNRLPPSSAKIRMAIGNSC